MIYNLTAKINNSDRKFIDKFHSFSVNSSMNENISGGATRPFLRESILAGIGEYFERDAVFAFNRNFENKKHVGCLNILTKKVNYFDICNEKYKIYFSDTCGCACHTNSDNLVNNCFSIYIFLLNSLFIKLKMLRRDGITKRWRLFPFALEKA